MEHLKALNSKETRKIASAVSEQFGDVDFSGYVLFRNNEGKIFLLSRKFLDLDMTKLHVNNLGMYFCKEESDGIRLTIEGSQLVYLKKNVVDIDEEDMRYWMRGEPIEVEESGNRYVVLRHRKDILGCGKLKDGFVLNSVQKGRRVTGIMPGDIDSVRDIK